MSDPLSGSEKEPSVEALFSAIAPKYDLMNSVLSLGRHKAWRRRAAQMSGLGPGGRALDVCCGTGDFALDLARIAGAEGHVIGLDFARPMIDLAKEKAGRKRVANVEFVVGNARSLPFEDNSFDCATVGFGIRNIPDVDEALGEMARVVRPGGKVVCLEISRVRSPILRIPWMLYFYALTPYTALVFRAGRSAYEYLPKSVKEFMSREELAARFEAAGLMDVAYHDMMFGVVCVHIGTKPT
jgi:demethylmenaquinone methyltransferase/2-methoxy-6-polyprenyl-1,4-benzoquinol methylase